MNASGLHGRQIDQVSRFWDFMALSYSICAVTISVLRDPYKLWICMFISVSAWQRSTCLRTRSTDIWVQCTCKNFKLRGQE